MVVRIPTTCQCSTWKAHILINQNHPTACWKSSCLEMERATHSVHKARNNFQSACTKNGSSQLTNWIKTELPKCCSLMRSLSRISLFGGTPSKYPSHKSNPQLDASFGSKLVLWASCKLWHVQFKCVRCLKLLTSKDVYNRARTVLDLKNAYYLAYEYFECHDYRGTSQSWDH